MNTFPLFHKRVGVVVFALLLFCSPPLAARPLLTMSRDVLLDKIKGGWAGQTIGCAYGGPTEFCYRGVIIPDDTEIKYPEHHLQFHYDRFPGLFDDVYMDLTFVKVFCEEGLDASAESMAKAFAYAPYPLWHANQQARYNIMQGIMPPQSGYWKNNPHADCIDYQIESDFAGLMSPGMPNAASKISDKVGHLMNYGDGWYGGVFMGAMYAAAFVENDVLTIVEQGLKTIPTKSKFHKCISDVIRWYKEEPTNWKRTWALYNEKYSEDTGCPELILAPGNIDATMNSAYVVMGLLFGHGDFGKTMEISTRCGQDSDCNPSSAAGILATMIGYSNIPEKWMPNLHEVEDRNFSYTTMSLNDVYQKGFELALKNIERNGGKVLDDKVLIKVQKPKAVRLEQGFTNMTPKLLAEGIDRLGNPDSGQNVFEFEGIGITIYGNISCPDKDYEAQLEVTVDGKKDKVMKFTSNFHNRTADCLYWNYNLRDGKHRIEFRLLNPREDASIKAHRFIRYERMK